MMLIPHMPIIPRLSYRLFILLLLFLVGERERVWFGRASGDGEVFGWDGVIKLVD